MSLASDWPSQDNPALSLVKSSPLIAACVQVTRPVCHTTWVQEVVTKPVMVRWCMEKEEEELEYDEHEEEEEINTIEDNGPLLDARLLWENL